MYKYAITYMNSCPSTSPFSAKCTPAPGTRVRMGARSCIPITWLPTTAADWTQPGIIRLVSHSNVIEAQSECLLVAHTEKMDIGERWSTVFWHEHMRRGNWLGEREREINRWEETTGSTHVGNLRERITNRVTALASDDLSGPWIKPLRFL